MQEKRINFMDSSKPALLTLLVLVSNYSEVADLMPFSQRYVTPTVSLMERKLIEACTAHIMAHPSLTQVTPVLFSRSGEN